MIWSFFVRHEPVSEADIQAWVDDRLPTARRPAVEAHFAFHPEDAVRARTYREQREMLAELGNRLVFADAEDFRPELLEALASRIDRGRRVRRTAMAAAVAGILLVGGATAWYGVPGHDPAPPITQAAVPDLLFDPASFANLEEVAAEEDSIDWLGKHLVGRSLRRPDLETLGLRFVRGTVLRNLRTPAIRLVYEDELGEKLYIFVGVVRGEEEKVFGIVPEGYVSLQWRNGPVVFALIAPTDSPQLVSAMQLVSDSVEIEQQAQPVEAAAAVAPAEKVAPAEGVEKVVAPAPGGEAAPLPAATDSAPAVVPSGSGTSATKPL